MSRAATRSGELLGGLVPPNFIFATSDQAWLYVPRARMLVPVGEVPQTSDYLSEDGLGRLTT